MFGLKKAAPGSLFYWIAHPWYLLQLAFAITNGRRYALYPVKLVLTKYPHFHQIIAIR
jgi:hypothetical protein